MQMTRILSAALVLAGSLLAQSASQMKWPDIGLFGGYQGWDLWRSKFSSRPGAELVSGGVAGVRAGYDIGKHFGVEGAYTYGVNNLRAFPDRSGPVRPLDVGYGARNHHLSLNPMWHFAGPESKLRPYVTAGLGALSFRPTGDAGRESRLPANAGLGAPALKDDLMPAFNWGGGVKYKLTELLQLRFDARNIITRQPHMGLAPNNAVPGGVFAAPGGTGSGLQATAGLGFDLGGLLGGRGGAAAPSTTSAAPKPGKMAASGRSLRVNLAGGPATIPTGGSAKLSASTDAPDASKVKYLWTVNGMGTDATGPEFIFYSKGREPGDYKICGTATSTEPGWAPGSECYTVTVTALPPVRATITGVSRINEGETARFTAGSDAPAGETVVYDWTLNGQPVPATAGPEFAFNSTGRQPGAYEACVVAAAHGMQSAKECTKVEVVACTGPAISVGTISATEVFAGERVNIPVTAQPGSCASPVRISYRAGDGTIAGDAAGGSATGVFDSTSVAFDRTNRSKLQRKNVVVTATATDEKGATVSAQTSVVVKLAPMAQRLDDVLFASHNSRVNNCGKRVLLEMLTPRLRDDPEAKVVLIGHIDETENGNGAPAARNKKGRRVAAAPVRHLDKARVLNAAAVISGGEGICPALELSRIKVAYAGKTKNSEPRPTFCGSSTEVRATKRAGAKADARAPFRRVEVWIVPAGAPMPTGVTIQDAPAAEIKALKCPK